jgi:hypothetical protein
MPVSDWTPDLNHIQRGLVDGEFTSAVYHLLAAGPPRLSALGGSAMLGEALENSSGVAANEIVWPIGMAQNLNLSQNRPFSRIFEIGSTRSYWIPGRTVGQLGFGTVYYHGPSLLRKVYAYYQDLIGEVQVPAVFTNVGSLSMPNPHDVIVPPGYENLFLNLASDMFDQPIGFLLWIKDVDKETIGAVYFESCVIPTHTWATDANNVIVQESVGVQFERVVPVNIQSVDLVT